MTSTRATLVFLSALAAGALFAIAGSSGSLKDSAERLEMGFASLRPVERAANVLLLDPGAKASSLNDASLSAAFLRMAEFEARAAILDMPSDWAAANRPHAAISRKALGSAFDLEFSRMDSNISELFSALKRGSIRADEAPGYVSKLLELIDAAKGRLLDEATSRDEESEAALGQSLRFFGGVFLPFDLGPKTGGSRQLGIERFALRGLAMMRKRPAASLVPVAAGLPPFAGAAGVGFVSPSGLKPGSRARVKLLVEGPNGYYGQIAFSALLELLGNPAIALDDGSMTLRNARLPGSAAADIIVPLDEEGRLLVDLPASGAASNFRRLPWSDFDLHAGLEAGLVAALRGMEGSGYLAGRGEYSTMVDLYDYAAGLQAELLSTGRADRLEEWRKSRERFFALADSFLRSPAEDELAAPILRELSSPGLGGGETVALGALRKSFAAARELDADLGDLRSRMRAALRDSLCVVSPIEASLLASATIIDSIVSRSFSQEVPAPVVMASSLLCALAVAFAALGRRAVAPLVVAASTIILAVGASALLALFGGWYLNPIASGGGALGALVAAMALRPRSRASGSDPAEA